MEMQEYSDGRICGMGGKSFYYRVDHRFEKRCTAINGGKGRRFAGGRWARDRVHTIWRFDGLPGEQQYLGSGLGAACIGQMIQPGICPAGGLDIGDDP